MSTTKILIAGFGGQGVLFAGKYLAYQGLLEGRQLSWLPSYGPEMRGGTARQTAFLAPLHTGLKCAAELQIAVSFFLTNQSAHRLSQNRTF